MKTQSEPAAATSRITLTSMGAGVGGPPPKATHYEGSYSDALAVYKGLGPHVMIQPGPRQAVQFVRAELHLNGEVVAGKAVRAPAQQPQAAG